MAGEAPATAPEAGALPKTKCIDTAQLVRQMRAEALLQSARLNHRCHLVQSLRLGLGMTHFCPADAAERFRAFEPIKLAAFQETS